MSQAEKPLPAVVVSRPDWMLWWNAIWLGVFWAGLTWMLTSWLRSPGPISGLPLIILLFFLLGGGFVMLVLHLLWTRIRADERGLSWRSWTSPVETRVDWDQVKEYYIAPGAEEAPTVETELGKLILTKRYSRHDLLKHYIEEHATGARNKGWWRQESEVLSGEAQQFTYPRSYLTRFPGTVLFLSIFPVAFYFAETQSKTSIIPSSLSVGGVLYALFAIPWTGLWVWIYYIVLRNMWRVHLFVLSHPNDRIQVNENTIRWTDGGRIVEAKWDEVQDLEAPAARFTMGPHVLKTHHGSFELEFGGLRNGAVLKDLISRRLPSSPERQ